MEVGRQYYSKLCPTSCIQNSRRVFRLPRRATKTASVSRFVSLKKLQHKPSPGENPRKGAAAPFLVVLRGFVKGEIRNSPLTILSFDRQRRFLSHMRKKAGLKSSNGGIPFNGYGPRSGGDGAGYRTAPPAQRKKITHHNILSSYAGTA